MQPMYELYKYEKEPKNSHVTPLNLYKRGVGVCDGCGGIVSIDDKFCNSCNKEICLILKKGKK